MYGPQFRGEKECSWYLNLSLSLFVIFVWLVICLHSSPFLNASFILTAFVFVEENTCPVILSLKLSHSLKDICKLNTEIHNQAEMYSCFSNKIYKGQAQRSALLLSVHDGPGGICFLFHDSSELLVCFALLPTQKPSAAFWQLYTWRMAGSTWNVL